MENLTTINLVWGLIGIVFFTLLRLKNPLLKKQKLSIGYWLLDNWVDMILSAILFFVFIQYQQEVVGLFGLQIANTEDISTGLRSFILGTAAYPAVSYVSQFIKDYQKLKK